MTRRRRILYVQRPSGGGSATALYDLVRRLDRDRYEPVVLFYDENRYCQTFEDLGAEVLVLRGEPSSPSVPGLVKRSAGPLRNLASVRAASRLLRRDWPLSGLIARRMREAAVDLVHHNDNPRGDRASILAARRAGVSQICHVRYMPKYFRPLDRALASLVEAFVYVSRAVEEHHRSHVGAPRSRGTVIYDPPNFGDFELSNGAAGAVRAEFGLADGQPLVSNVGRLVPWKGQDHFLDAFADVAVRHPGAVALVVGSTGGKESAEAYADALRARARTHGLQDRVIFTGFRSDVPAIMAASDVVVHSASEPEPFGRVVLEAMAAGRPVVATAAGGVPEIVDPERTGLLVPPGDPAAMARAIESLLSDPAEARSMGARGRRVARVRFDPVEFVAQVEHLYDRVLGTETGREG